MVINYLNSHVAGEGEIPPTNNPAVIGYVDVDSDGVCAPIDALKVINYINSHPTVSGGCGGEGEAAASPALLSGAWNSGQGEGEGQVPVPQNAAEYYAQQPLHLLNIQGTDQPCTCAACMAARAAATGSSEPSSATGISAAISSLIASAADDTGFGDGSLAASASLKISSLSSSLASRPILATAASANLLQERNAFLASARKSAIDSLDRLTSQLEETLDDIAADISQADPGDGLV
jgi:hypothetical protein